MKKLLEITEDDIRKLYRLHCRGKEIKIDRDRPNNRMTVEFYEHGELCEEVLNIGDDFIYWEHWDSNGKTVENLQLSKYIKLYDYGFYIEELDNFLKSRNDR